MTKTGHSPTTQPTPRHGPPSTPAERTIPDLMEALTASIERARDARRRRLSAPNTETELS